MKETEVADDITLPAPSAEPDLCPRKTAARWREASAQALADLSEMRLRVLRQDAVMRQALDALEKAQGSLWPETSACRYTAAATNKLRAALDQSQ